MEKIGKIIFNIIFFLSIGVAASAEVQVQATVDRNELPLGDSFVLSVSVTTGDSSSIGEPRLPDIQGLQLVNRTSSMSSRSIFSNGSFQFVRTQTYSFVLSPERTGKITIGGIDVVVGGQTHSTKPITITVDNAGSVAPRQAPRQQQPKRPDPFADDEQEDYVGPGEAEDELFDQLLQRRGQIAPRAGTQPINPNEAFFIQAEADKEKAYEGEQVTASWYLYTKEDIRNIDTLKYPSLTGFWKEDIEVVTNLNFTTEVINGIAYRKALLASYALFPLKAGTATIDQYKARCTVLVRNTFGSFFGQPYTFTKASQPIKITVLPLPIDKPKSFTGAVGNFQMKVTAEKNTVPANEPFSIKVRYEGRGNAKVIEAPTLTLPDTVEQFDAKNESKFFPDGRSYKEFELFLVPRAKGDLTVPPFEFSYFDTQSKRYVTTHSSPLNFKITEGRNQGSEEPERLKESERKVDQPRVLELPGLVYREDVWQTLNKYKYMLWATIFAVFILYMGIATVRTLGRSEVKKTLTMVLASRFGEISKLSPKKEIRKIGAQTVNTVYYILNQMSSLETDNDSIDQLLNATPPSVKKELNGSLSESIKYFEKLAFAPEAALAELQDPRMLDQNLKDIKKLLQKAISVYEEKS